jgi:hypothetical protein
MLLGALFQEALVIGPVLRGPADVGLSPRQAPSSQHTVARAPSEDQVHLGNFCSRNCDVVRMANANATDVFETTPEPSAADQPIQKAFSCVLCAQRKVKCDRSPGSCSNCSKARVSCLYKAPPPPRRRRKGVRDVDVATKMPGAELGSIQKNF